MYQERIRNQALLDKVISADEAAWMIEDGMNVGTSGFTPSGYPKLVPLALAEQVKSGQRKLKVNLWTGASTGYELDGTWAEIGLINKRLPYQTDSNLRKAINSQAFEPVDYIDMHLSQMAQSVRYGFLGELDVAIVEACAITEEGYLVPTTAVGNMAAFVPVSYTHLDVYKRQMQAHAMHDHRIRRHFNGHTQRLKGPHGAQAVLSPKKALNFCRSLSQCAQHHCSMGY